MANYPQELAQDAVCQSHTGHMTGLWFLPARPIRLNTNEWMNCQLLCFWRLALSTVVEVSPRPFFPKYCSFKDFFYIHGSAHRESNLITIQQDANYYYFCRQRYMFRVLTPIIRSSCNCNYSFWHWLTGSTTVRSRCWVGTQQRERMAVDPFNQYV